MGSNNTNKLSPQEPTSTSFLLTQVQIIQINLVLKNVGSFEQKGVFGSNNTNKLSPQEPLRTICMITIVQIIQINLVLKNLSVSYVLLDKFK